MLKIIILLTFIFYFVFPYAIIMDAETDSHRTNKREVYYILLMKSCVLLGIIVSLISWLVGFFVINLGYMYYVALFVPSFILVSNLSYCIYEHCYPKDSESTIY